MSTPDASASPVDRRARILTSLDARGRVHVDELAHQLGVSKVTIRRDLHHLTTEGAVHRRRGGALPTPSRSTAERYNRQARAKELIAGKIVALIGEGGGIGIDASTTLQRLSPHLSRRDLTVVTNGLDTFHALSGRPRLTALLTGGRYDPLTRSLVGPLAQSAAHALLLRRLFVSSAAIDPALGPTEESLDDLAVKRALASVSTDVILAVDHTKLGRHCPVPGLPPARIAMLVTDLDPHDPRLDPYRHLWPIR